MMKCKLASIKVISPSAILYTPCSLDSKYCLLGSTSIINTDIFLFINIAILGESCHHAGAAALATEPRKLHCNGPKCQELGWSCIPLAVKTYGN